VPSCLHLDLMAARTAKTSPMVALWRAYQPYLLLTDLRVRHRRQEHRVLAHPPYLMDFTMAVSQGVRIKRHHLPQVWRLSVLKVQA
jgi:hypothetical protein